jgi:hypothetical protein
MKIISLGLVIVLLIIGVAINLIWPAYAAYGYIPLGIYLVIWLVGIIRGNSGGSLNDKNNGAA